MLIYRHHRGAEIRQTRGRLQPYAVWVPMSRGEMAIEGFDSEYLPALKRLAKATKDTVLLARLNETDLIERVPKEMQHRPLRPVA